ncbi:MAG: hypothetical protein N2738_04020 [Thermodesulfovibrionales bacterium]|nr:hypothetical protein [Thermodesulfovibrionales bacterium]
MNLLRLYHFKKLTLIIIFSSIFLISCAPKKSVKTLELTDYNLAMLMEDLKTIKSIEATLEVEYERGDASFGGDMYLKVDDNATIIRIYYMGFLAGEIIEENGIIKNKAKMSKKRAEMLLNALKRSVFWWRFDFDQIIETEDKYYLSSEGREVVIDSKRLLPISQRIVLENGDGIEISYSEPLPIDKDKESVKPTDLYQSNILIEYQRYRVNAKVTSLKVSRY